MYKNIKWTEIIEDESQIVKKSALYIIPLSDTTCKLIYVDDEGDRRQLSSLGSDANYVYNQGTPSKVWNILNPLGKIATVDTRDSADTPIRGSVTTNDGIVVIIEFNVPVSGKAILN